VGSNVENRAKIFSISENGEEALADAAILRDAARSARLLIRMRAVKI